MGVEVYINKNLVSNIVKFNNITYILFKSGNQVLYRTFDGRLVGAYEQSYEKINGINTETILQNKYTNSRNDFDLVRDQLLPKPQLR